MVGYHTPKSVEVVNLCQKQEEDFSKFFVKFENLKPAKPLIHQVLGWDFPQRTEPPLSDVIPANDVITCPSNDVPLQNAAVQNLSESVMDMDLSDGGYYSFF